MLVSDLLGELHKNAFEKSVKQNRHLNTSFLLLPIVVSVFVFNFLGKHFAFFPTVLNSSKISAFFDQKYFMWGHFSTLWKLWSKISQLWIKM